MQFRDLAEKAVAGDVRAQRVIDVAVGAAVDLSLLRALDLDELEDAGLDYDEERAMLDEAIDSLEDDISALALESSYAEQLDAAREASDEDE